MQLVPWNCPLLACKCDKNKVSKVVFLSNDLTFSHTWKTCCAVLSDDFAFSNGRMRIVVTKYQEEWRTSLNEMIIVKRNELAIGLFGEWGGYGGSQQKFVRVEAKYELQDTINMCKHRCTHSIQWAEYMMCLAPLAAVVGICENHVLLRDFVLAPLIGIPIQVFRRRTAYWCTLRPSKGAPSRDWQIKQT